MMRRIETRQIETRPSNVFGLRLVLIGTVLIGTVFLVTGHVAARPQEPKPDAPAAETPAARQAWMGFPVVEVGPPPHVWRGKPISLSLKDADLVEVLRSFAKLTDVNIVIDPRVKGRVTAELKDVPWDQALYVILKTQGLGVEVTGNVWTFQARRDMAKPRP